MFGFLCKTVFQCRDKSWIVWVYFYLWLVFKSCTIQSINLMEIKNKLRIGLLHFRELFCSVNCPWFLVLTSCDDHFVLLFFLFFLSFFVTTLIREATEYAPSLHGFNCLWFTFSLSERLLMEWFKVVLVGFSIKIAICIFYRAKLLLHVHQDGRYEK